MTPRRTRPSRLRAAALRNCRLLAAGASALLGSTALLVAATGSSSAAPSFTVLDTSDAPDARIDGTCMTAAGTCTLRAAVQEANAARGARIDLAAGGLGDYVLSIPPGNESTPNAAPDAAVGDLDINAPITITGTGPDSTVIAGNGTFRIFDIHFTGNLTLSGVTLQGGAGDPDGATGHEHGGAIHNHGRMSLDHVAVISSASANGWGGGGITNAGQFIDNSGTTHPAGQAQMVDVTVARNSSTLRGGGIENSGALQMMNVTVAENSAPAGHGGGVFDGAAAALTWNIGNDLVAANTGGDCQLSGGPTVTSSGGNLAGDGTCGFTNGNDRTGDPEFDTTVFGPPLFYPLQRSSPAVDDGSLACFQDDIRGVWRAQDGDGDGTASCDSGSFERETPPVGSLAVLDHRITEGNAPPRTVDVAIVAPGLTHSVSVVASTQDGTARAGSDYVAKKQTLKLGPSVTKAHFKVDLVADTTPEPDETFKVVLSSPVGGTIDDGEGLVTIVNDD
jgi:hypothetical protein